MHSTTLLAGQRILVFVGDEYEDLELWYPKLRLIEAGADVTVAGAKANVIYHGKHGYPCLSDEAIDRVEAADFHGLICPGGWMPDKLRRDPKVGELDPALARHEDVAALGRGGREGGGGGGV